jgi:outer membrane lipoprotein-sorting protein
MTKFLRTASTRRLLAVIGGLVAAIAAGTAIAVAAAGSGPVAPPARLANAIRGALSAPQVRGISARISFTNHLIDASSIQGTDPLLQGATGRLWMSSDHRIRLELQSDNGDAQVVVNNGSFSVYDPTSNTVYEGSLPARKADKSTASKPDKLPSLAEIQTDLNRLAQHLDISGAIAGDVAGQPAYTVRISPKHDGGLLGDAEIAWDAVHGVPLKIAVYASTDRNSPVLELKVTDISFGAVHSSDLAVAPPRGAKVVKVATPSGRATGSAASKRSGAGARHGTDVTGDAAVARHLPFALDAPRSLVGIKQRSVTLLDWNHSPAALVAYGQGIGGIAVIEQTAKPAAGSQSSSAGADHQGLSLPTVSIKGATGQELDTALGTMIRFTRGGVSYTVLGSVPPSAAELAARAL